MFLIVEGFLQPNSTVTLKDVIDRLLDIFPDGDMRFINSICLELAEQIPYSHPSHAKLARLLWGVERSEARIEKMKRKVYLYALPRLLKNFFDPTFVVTRTSTYYNTQIGAASFCQTLQKNIVNDKPLPEADPVRYVNFQAFEAHLNDTGIFLASPHRASQAMDSAFSDEDGHSQDTPEIHDAWVLGAAQWILWNG